MLADARRLPLPRVDTDPFNKLVRLTQACARAGEIGRPNSLELFSLTDAWEAVLPGHELPVTGKIFHGTATSTRKDGTKEVTEVYVGDGVNEKTVELRRGNTYWLYETTSSSFLQSATPPPAVVPLGGP